MKKKVVIAIDSFKGCMDSLIAAEAVKRGIERSGFDADVDIFALADGGEGTSIALARALGAIEVPLTVCGPARKEVKCSYWISQNMRTAIMEMSACAGITLVAGEEKNPERTTTYGVGEMILDAVESGCERIIVGIGGSATNDGGIGMLAALGFEFFDAEGALIEPYGAIAAGQVASISDEKVSEAVRACKFSVACDVTNPLCGELGCSAVFAAQKGADAASIARMDGYLQSYASVVESFSTKADRNAAGAGAAGGLGFAFLSLLDARLLSGAELVIRESGLERAIGKADIVVTGEGRMDVQSSMGKAPSAVAAVAKKHGKPVIAFCGAISSPEGVEGLDIDGIFPIQTAAISLEDAMRTEVATANLEFTARNVFNVLGAAGK